MQKQGLADVAFEDHPEWGGFADVGDHTRCSKPATTWPLVKAALQNKLSVRPLHLLTRALADSRGAAAVQWQLRRRPKLLFGLGRRVAGAG